MPRLHVPAPLTAHSLQILPPATAHRVREVLRASVGDTLLLFDGRGGEYPGVVRRCQRDLVEVEVGAWQAVERESPLTITLAQGISRGERMDYTLQKAVELGVGRIVPLASARSQVKLDGERAERRRAHWLGIIVHACEQSGRDRIPVLDEIRTLPEFIASDTASLRLTLTPGATESLLSLARGHSDISLVIGPEGGLDPRELELLAAAGFRGARLGPRVLRTETAALVALTVLQTASGDLA